ncbi:MAG: metal-dependent hydrolase [Acidobacteria bacterium]|nr:metal-dependent hydrolase [Acidobacteriota bacterium]
MSRLAITWYGHSTFLLRTPGGRRVLIDPWFAGNPACPDSMKVPPAADVILVSHGHADHIGDLLPAARESQAPVVAAFEVCDWLEGKGIRHVRPMNKGGTQDVVGLGVTMTDARHSSGFVDEGRMIYMGEAAGYVLRLEDGLTVYYAGDTSLFGDMRLIGELHAPDIAFLPIGDRFTMDPSAAARAATWLGVKMVVPMHWGTFPLLTGTPAALRALLPPEIEMLDLQPGETAG